MKKLILSSVVAASLAVSCFAEGEETTSSSKSGFYMGVGYNSMTGTHTIPYNIDMTSTYEAYGYEDTSSEDKNDIDADGSTIKIGLDKKSYRFELSYSSLKSEGRGEFFNSIDTNGINKTTQTYDNKFTGFDMDFIKPFTDNSLKPYLAAGLGYYSWDGYTGTTSSGDTRDRVALAYNLGAGVLYSFGNIELDIAYKWKKLDWEDATSSLTNSIGQKGGERTRTGEETTLTGLYAGINIHF